MRDLLTDLVTASRQQALLRASIVAATLVFAMAVLLSGDTSTWAIVILPVMGILCAINPHTGFPTATLLYLLGVWASGVESLWTPWSLPAALCLLVVHTSCALAAGTPAQAPLPPGLLQLYGVRVGLLAAATTLVWALAAAKEAFQVPGGVVAALAALAVLCAGLVLHYRLVTRQEEMRDPVAEFTDRRDPGRYGFPQGPH